jgi:hypothetical protein
MLRLPGQLLDSAGAAARVNVGGALKPRDEHIRAEALYAEIDIGSRMFFVQGFGFTVSETTRGAAPFLRCSTDHHNLVVPSALPAPHRYLAELMAASHQQ